MTLLWAGYERCGPPGHAWSSLTCVDFPTVNYREVAGPRTANQNSEGGPSSGKRRNPEVSLSLTSWV